MEQLFDYELENKYDFYAKYYLHYAIGTEFENVIEIDEKTYRNFLKKLNNTENAMIRIFATNTTVGFHKDFKTYVLHKVNQDVFNCLMLSQIYEHHQKRNESRRHLDDYYNQEDLDTIPSKMNIENEVLDKIEKQEVKNFLDSILLKKQSRRFFKHKIEGLTLTAIAKEEKRNVSVIKRSVDSAIEKILKKLKNF